MSKIAVLLPKYAMLEIARKVIRQEGADVAILKEIESADSVSEARTAVEQGAEIIVARGRQASYIKKYLNVPLVEITLSAQELGRMVVRAIKLTGKEKPSIAIISFQNMLADTSYFEEIFNIHLNVYYLNEIEDAERLLEQAIAERADAVLGGETVCRLAKQKELPALFLEAREDSIRDAIRIAQKMSYSAEVEKQQTAQFETVLDTSFNGIVKCNAQKEITIVNHMVENLLERKAEQIVGKDLCGLINELDEEEVDRVLNGKRDLYTTSIQVKQTPVMVSCVPIQYDEEIVGLILSFYKLTTTGKKNADSYRDMFLRGYVAKNSFADIKTQNKKMRFCVEEGKLFALSSKPIYIFGECGTEKEVFAQCIHNNSLYKGGPFITVNCSGLTEEKQMTQLFGNPSENDESLQKGALALGNTGTVFIAEVEKLSPVCQYRLYRAIQYDALIQNDIDKSQTLNNRIIVSSERNLSELVTIGEFRADLYYLLNGLVLTIPPLRERPEDIEKMVEECRKKFSKQYSRFFKITPEGMERLKSLEWNGNRIQLEAFCERLFLSVARRNIQETHIQYLWDELYPTIQPNDPAEKVIVYRHPEAQKITELLEKHMGNRARVAEELGISTTTLWRHMKKYGVTEKGERAEDVK